MEIWVLFTHLPVAEPNVLIIEPVVDMSDEKRPLKKFFANDIALAKLIYNSILGQKNG